MDDRTVINRILYDGDTGLFGEIVRRYSGMVYSTAIGIVHRADMAEDIVQETFVKAYSSMARWRGGASIGPWLVSIAHNLAVTAAERASARRSVPVDGVAVADEDAEYSHEREQLICRMERAIASLPEQERTILRMFYFDKIPAAQIAERIGMGTSAVLVRLHRLRHKLKNMIDNEEY